jgi:hypothetical protein
MRAEGDELGDTDVFQAGLAKRRRLSRPGQRKNDVQK